MDQALLCRHHEALHHLSGCANSRRGKDSTSDQVLPHSGGILTAENAETAKRRKMRKSSALGTTSQPEVGWHTSAESFDSVLRFCTSAVGSNVPEKAHCLCL